MGFGKKGSRSFAFCFRQHIPTACLVFSVFLDFDVCSVIDGTDRGGGIELRNKNVALSNVYSWSCNVGVTGLPVLSQMFIM